MKLIDSHCHLDDFFHDGRLDEVLKNAADVSIEKMVAVGTHGEDWIFYEKLVKNHKNIFHTVGLHPLCMKNLSDLDGLDNFLKNEIKPVAIGEIGLDYHRLPEGHEPRETEKALQQRAFATQLEIAKANGLPVVIHSRQAFEDTLRALKNSKIPGEKILFHCYDYGVEEMKTLQELGIFTSFSGMLTFKKALVNPLKIASMERLLLETDCPFLTPEPHRPKVNEPAFIRATAKFAANILAMEEGTLCDLTRKNTEKFFGIG
jgi:TatD DNase family protein